MKNKLLAYFLFLILPLVYAVPAYAQTCTETGSITRVKNRSAGAFEYVIFDIKNPEDGAVPLYEVKTAKPPFTDYSGDETYEIEGGKFKSIVFRSVYWMCEIPQKYSLPQKAVKGVKLLSSFEGIVEFAVGYRSRSSYLGTYHYLAGRETKVVMKFRK